MIAYNLRDSAASKQLRALNRWPILLHMKTKLILSLVLLAFAGSARAIDRAELDNRIRTLTSRFEAMQQRPDRRIPAENLRKAQGIVLLDRTKAGFIFAYQGGSGVAMVRDPKTAKWGPAACLTANEASLGFQVGGERNFFVILFMSTNATRLLTVPNVMAGGEARGTAGDATAKAEGTMTPPDADVLVYDDRKGLYGGAALKGGSIAPDANANHAYYGQFLSMHEILFEHKVQPTAAATELARKLDDYSKAPAYSKK
jgi:lipid-binding SYLF domain-containing protein